MPHTSNTGRQDMRQTVVIGGLAALLLAASLARAHGRGEADARTRATEEATHEPDDADLGHVSGLQYATVSSALRAVETPKP